MSGGKGGSTTTEIPRWVRDAVEPNLQRAQQASQIGYVPHYGPSQAAFSPMQNQAFDNIGAAGEAFGLIQPGQSMRPTMQPTDYGGGLQGHSSGPLFELALAELESRRPAQAQAVNDMFIEPTAGAAPGRQPPLQPQPQPAPQQQYQRPGPRSQFGDRHWSDFGP